MEQIKGDEHSSDLSLVGFEKVFVQVEQMANNEQSPQLTNIHEQSRDFDEQSDEHDAESFELVTMAEAARRLQMPYPTLRRQVVAGKIPSVSGPEGKPLVKLMVTEQSNTATKQSAQPSEQKAIKTEQNPLSSEYSMTIQRLLEQMEMERHYSKALNEKLEAANHRNGYLEAQVDQQGEQIKLLTDSRHKSGSLWRFWSWFTGR